MNTTFQDWLKHQVIRMEHEIALNPVFQTDAPASRDELSELRRLAVIHRFLRSQLEQIEEMRPPVAPDPLDRVRTREIDLRETCAHA